MAFTIEVAGHGRIKTDTPLMGQEVLSLATKCKREGVVAWRVNRILRPLGWVLDESSCVEFVDTSSFEGMEIYRKTLIFLLVIACKNVLNRDIIVRHSMNDSYYCDFADYSVSKKDVAAIAAEMQSLVQQQIPIQMATLPLDKARRIFKQQSNLDKEGLMRWTGFDPVVLYRCAGLYGYFGGPLAANTGMIKVFDLCYYAPGLLLLFPSITSPDQLPPLQMAEKLMNVFREYSRWLDVLGVGTMDSLHERVSKGLATELILVSEALHSEALSTIAASVLARPQVRLLCLAGPSSSGKTTTSQRLSIQLQVGGKKPVPLALDNYYVDRDKTPLDEDGEYDFEALEALDVQLINDHLEALLAGEEVVVPHFDFVTGKRKPGKKLSLRANDILIIEGIHGLNNKLSASIPDELKYKIFISPLTGVSLDRHNRIGTTDTRLLRRMVRDHRTRGYAPENTLLRWPSVIRGSQKHIFPYEEEADVLFNTSLVYELSVLKGYAEPMLRSVSETSPAYGEAQRLLSILHFVPGIPSDNVPNLSIMREFIGGGCFDL